MNTRYYLTRLIKHNLSVFMLNCLMVIFLFIIPLLPGIIIRQIFNSLTQNAAAGFNQWSLIILLIVISLGHIVILFATEATNITLRIFVSSLLQTNLLNIILSRPGAKALLLSPGESISRFRDDVKVIENAISSTTEILGQVALMLSAFAVMLWINPFITLVTVIPLLIILHLVDRFGKYVEKYHRLTQEATGRVTGFIGEMFGAVQAVQVSASKKHVTHRFEQLNKTREIAAIRSRTFSAFLDTIIANISNLSIGVVLLLAGSLQYGQFTVGDLALFMIYLNWLAQTTGFLGHFLVSYKQSSVSIQRLTEISPTTPCDQLVNQQEIYLWGDPPPIPYVIKQQNDHLQKLVVKGLSHRHNGNQQGIKDIHFTIERGTFTVITGRVGSGKTTLLRVLLGLLPRDAGDIYWNDCQITNPATFFVPPRAAYVSQVPHLFSNTMQENILLGLPIEKVDLPKAVTTAVLGKTIEDMDIGLNTRIGPRGVRLSGGQAQRVAAARALVRESELLILDDLSSALDIKTESMLWERLSQQTETTCLIVSHRRPIIQQADHVIVLKEGQIEATGKLETILETSQEMKKLWYTTIE